MVVYVEYALAENFLLDGMLLWLSLKAAKRKIHILRLLLAATLGAVFAVLFPIFSLSTALSYALKGVFGILLCGVCFGKINGLYQLKAFAFCCAFFFAFTFAFAGMLFALLNVLPLGAGNSYEIMRAPATLTLCGGVAFAAGTVAFIKKVYRKRAQERLLYPCEITASNGKRASVKGFYDSGNSAEKNGLPVCFLSLDIVYDLFYDEWLYGNGVAPLKADRADREDKGEKADKTDKADKAYKSEKTGKKGGQVCDELTVATVGGTSTVRLFRGTLTVEAPRGGRGEKVKKEVYFSPAPNMLSREYKLLLHSRIFE